MKPISVADLREFAKLNMDEKCFQSYLQIIEPSIKSIIQHYFGGWVSIESSMLRIIMRVNGVYKTSSSVIFDKDDDRSKQSDLVDLKKYKKFEDFSFKKKLDNLLENKIIGKNTHKFLDYLRLKRNNAIHGTDAQFTDEDREWFEMGHIVINNIYFAIHTKNNVELKTRMEESAENTSKILLEKIT